MLSAAKHLAGADCHDGDAGSFSTMVMLLADPRDVLDASGALPPQHDVLGVPSLACHAERGEASGRGGWPLW